MKYFSLEIIEDVETDHKYDEISDEDDYDDYDNFLQGLSNNFDQLIDALQMAQAENTDVDEDNDGEVIEEGEGDSTMNNELENTENQYVEYTESK